MITYYNSENVQVGSVSPTVIVLIAAAILLVGIAIYLITGFGIRRMGINRNLSKTKYAFVPIMRWLLIGEIAGGINFFGKPFKKFGIVMAAVSGTLLVFALFMDVVNNLPIIYYAFSGENVSIRYQVVETIYNISIYDYVPYVGAEKMYPYCFSEWFLRVINVVGSLTQILFLVYMIGLVMLSSSFFRKYVSVASIWFTILSILPVLVLSERGFYGFTVKMAAYLFSAFGIIAFCIRNKPMVDYKQYLANRYGFYGQRRYGAENNPYSNYQGGDKQQRKDDPFENSSDKSEEKPKDNGDPFDDFFNGN